MRTRLAAVAFALVLTGCFRKQGTVESLREEFVYSTLAFSPVSAAAAGYHRHGNSPLDEMLDDVSQSGLANQHGFYRAFQKKLSSVDPGKLSPEDRADHRIMSNATELALLDFDTLKTHRRNPTFYVELIGNGLFNPFVLEYAPLEERYRHIIARLEKIPAFVENAARNLESSPDVWTTVAIVENDGNIALIDKTLRPKAPSNVRRRFETAATAALESLREFSDWMRRDLAGRQSDWRLGGPAYDQKFRYVLGVSRTPTQVLAEAEEQLRLTRQRMAEIARPLHSSWFGGVPPKDAGKLISQTLARIAERHSTPESYFSDARRDLKEVRDFVRARNIVPLPPRDNLQVIETPEFMRGIYAVGGFNPAPPLEPNLGAFYWLTPTSEASMFREYNYWGLKLLTIHEAIPGHYAQFEYANSVEPESRRLLRAIYSNGPYVEGWAVYATEVMLDSGYLDGSPEMRLTFLKQMLRVVANTILDVRLHTQGMTDQQALDLMMHDTFQEPGEATAKLRRAKLSSCQLPTYFVGYREWKRIRTERQQASGQAFDQAGFHKAALAPGAVPLTELPSLLPQQ